MSQPAKILAVDDEPDFELLIKQRFRQRIRKGDLAFRFARHGEEALAVLAERSDDPVEDELGAFIDALSEDEQVDLVALAWLGRDGGTVADWTDVRREAADAHNDRTAAYLLGMPLLADFIEEGLNVLGVSLEEFELGRL